MRSARLSSPGCGPTRDAEVRSESGLRQAQPERWEVRGGMTHQGRAQRWPEWTPTPLWPCREAQGVGRAWAAQHAHASCADLLRLSERSAESAQRVPQHRPMTEHRRLPRSAAQGTRQVGSPFLCLLSFGDPKESRCAAGRTSRPAAHPPFITSENKPNRPYVGVHKSLAAIKKIVNNSTATRAAARAKQAA